MTLSARPISWIKAAYKDFLAFPVKTQEHALDTLSIVAMGQHPDHVKPLKGFAEGVVEIVLKERGDAYRVVYALKLGRDIWILHAFQKKSTQGIKTPQREIDVIKQRIKMIKESKNDS